MFKRIKKLFIDQKKQNDNYWIFASMLAGSVFTLIAAFALSVEAVELARNPNAILSCSINELLNCATVGNHPSAHLFGFPNAFLGIMTAPVVMTVAVAGLARVKFPRFFMFVAQIFYTLGLLFAYYLLYISLFVIGVMCPWCLVVMASTTFVWFAITRYNIRENNLYLPKKISDKAKRFVAKDFDKLFLFLLLAAVVFTILIKYRDGIFGV